MIEIKRKYLKFLLVIPLVFFFLSACGNQNENTNNTSIEQKEFNESSFIKEEEEEEQEYLENIQPLKKISSNQFDEISGNTSGTFVYFGRKTCPYCREFVKELNYNVSKNKNEVYYIDTENPNDTYLGDLLTDLEIDVVPTMLKVKENSITLFDVENGNLEEFLK